MNLWRKMSDVILRLMDAQELDPSIVPIFGFVAPAFLLRINGNLNITIDDYMLSKLQEVPLMQTIQLDA
jgi:hypothetical protein